MKDERLLELAIEGLQDAKKRIDAELTELLARVGIKITTIKKAQKKAKASGRKVRTPAQKKAQSQRMKAIWAKKKAKK